MKDKKIKIDYLETAIGLQQVDNLKVSDYFLKQSSKYIKGEISLDDFGAYVESYYENKTNIEANNEEADKVAFNINKLIQDDSFSFSVGQYKAIHKALFHNVFSSAGKFRTYNFSKKEWVLNGKSVIYGDSNNLDESLMYDFELERKIDYSIMNIDEKIEHLALFTANLWQIHPFEEGNTRTTAVFIIKYLKQLGFEVNNEPFKNSSWYFRNALVRANYNNVSSGIYRDTSFLILFFRNLLLHETNELRNRNLNICLVDVYKNKENRPQSICSIIENNPKITISEIADKLGVSLRSAKTYLSKLQELGIIKREGGKKYGTWKVNKK